MGELVEVAVVRVAVADGEVEVVEGVAPEAPKLWLALVGVEMSELLLLLDVSWPVCETGEDEVDGEEAAVGLLLAAATAAAAAESDKLVASC